MRVAVWGYYEAVLRNGEIFFNPDAGGQENCSMKYNLLYQRCKKIGIDLFTFDMGEYKTADAFIFVDFPSKRLIKKIYKLNKKILFIHEECDVVTGNNTVLSDFDYFDKVLTFDDDLVQSSDKFIKYHQHSFIAKTKIPRHILKDKLLSAVYGNKKSSHPNELYSERLRVIKWYEKNHPDNFDLYGNRWDEFTFPVNNNSLRYLNTRYLSFFRKLIAARRPSWKGSIRLKKEGIEKYKFSLSFDNAKGINGYILEKIFDIFDSGSVPIYYGAPNISDYIPEGCYIDYRNFHSVEEMHKFLTSISDKEYQQYLERIEDFLSGDKSFIFSDKYFSETVISELKKFK